MWHLRINHRLIKGEMVVWYYQIVLIGFFCIIKLLEIIYLLHDIEFAFFRSHALPLLIKEWNSFLRPMIDRIALKTHPHRYLVTTSCLKLAIRALCSNFVHPCPAPFPLHCGCCLNMNILLSDRLASNWVCICVRFWHPIFNDFKIRAQGHQFGFDVKILQCQGFLRGDSSVSPHTFICLFWVP